MIWTEIEAECNNRCSYKNKEFNVLTVVLPTDKLKWLDGVCNCPEFFKKCMPKYASGKTIRLN